MLSFCETQVATVQFTGLRNFLAKLLPITGYNDVVVIKFYLILRVKSFFGPNSSTL